MRDDPLRHRRQSIRLKGFDYAQAGAYFVTICVQNRECLLGEVVDETMRMSEAGAMVHGVWADLSDHYPGVATDAFIVMPNHVHGVVILTGQPAGMSLSDVVHRFKTLTTKRYAEGVRDLAWPPFWGRLWLRNYYEHVIRDEASLDRIREYIAQNPARWVEDPENPTLTSPGDSDSGPGPPRGAAPTPTIPRSRPGR